VFVLMTPIFITLYFSFSFLLINSLMKKPFNDVIKLYNEKQEAAVTAEETA